MHGCLERLDALAEVSRGRGFQGVVEAAEFLLEVDGFGVAFLDFGEGLGADDAVAGGGAVDLGGGFGGEVFRGGGEDAVGVAGLVTKIELVEVEASALPVFVEVDRAVELRNVALDPAGVGADLFGGEVAVVAVEVDAGGVFAGAVGEAVGIQEGADVIMVRTGQGVFLQEFE